MISKPHGLGQGLDALLGNNPQGTVIENGNQTKYSGGMVSLLLRLLLMIGLNHSPSISSVTCNT